MTRKAATASPEALAPTARFRPAAKVAKRRIIMSIEGQEGSGKTHFALTAPGPIAYQNFDIGTEGVVDKFLDNKAVAIADYRLMIPALARDGREDEVIKEAVQLQADFEADYTAALKASRSVVWDTATETWALYRMAKFGRVAKVPPAKYEEVNTLFRELIRRAYEGDANLLLIHKQKAIWENNEKTGRLERAGFNDIGYLTQVNLLATAVRVEGEAGCTFQFEVTKCRPNPDLLGMTFTNPTFAEIACMVYPDTEEGDWQ